MFGVFEIVCIVVGVLAAGAVIGGFRLAGFAADRASWPLVLIFIALLYVPLAIGADAWMAVGIEALVAVPFVILAVAGFRGRRIWLAAGLALHALVDVLHHQVLANPGVPGFYPWLCLGFDAALAAWILVPRRGGRRT